MLWPYDFLLWLSQLIPGIIFSLAFMLIAYGIVLAWDQRNYEPPQEFEQPEPEPEPEPEYSPILDTAARKAIVRQVLQKYRELPGEGVTDEGETAQ